MSNKVKPAVCIGAAAALILAVSIFLAGRGGREDIVYKDTRVKYGSLTVGLTKEASVEIGTLEQKFDLYTCTLEVEDVLIEAGQEIKKGAPLYIMTAESVNETKAELAADIEDAKADYEMLQAIRRESGTQAKQEYETYDANGKYARLVYENGLKAYQEALDKAAEDVNAKQDAYNEKMLELAGLKEDYAEAQKLLHEAKGAVSENYARRHENAYYYTVYLNTSKTAQQLQSQLEEDICGMNKEIEQLLIDIQSSVRAMNQCRRDYEKAKLDLGQAKDIDAYYAGMASEWHSIKTVSLDNALSLAKRRYASAVEKLRAFDSRVQNNRVFSKYSGVVTKVYLSEGDKLSGGSSLAALNDGENVTMDVPVSEEDYSAVDMDGKVNIVFTAYPDEIYSGMITETSDAWHDSSSSSAYYTLTVTVKDGASMLYEGMTGDVTFVTKEVKQICYVSGRAVFGKGTKSYVKMRDEEGNIVEREIITGFSDGVNVEIISGLAEGDMVLIPASI